MKSIMNTSVLALITLAVSSSAHAAFSRVWGFDIYNQVKCFPADGNGNIPAGIESLNDPDCYFSYAWGHDAQDGNIDCFAVGGGQQFLAGTTDADTDHCRVSYVWGVDIYGATKCFGMGPDGNPVPNSLSVDDASCR